MAIVSPQPLKIELSWIFFRQNDPIQEELTCKYVQFLQWILKDDDVYFPKNHSILNLREFFHSEKYRVFTQHAAVAILRYSATMG